MHRSLLVAPLLVAGCGGSALPAPAASPPAVTAALPSDEAKNLEAFLEGVQKAKHYPAIAVAVATPKGIAWFGARGFSDDKSKLVDADTVFRIGSLTKTFSGAALLALRDDGKLSLDDAVEKTIPEIRGVVYPSAEHPPITLRELVTHRTGFPRLGKVDYTRGDRDVTEAELLGELDGLKLASTPGTATSYSNLAMSLVSVIVHRASGETYRDYVSHHLFAPLGMKASVWRREDVPEAHLALGHAKKDGAYVAGPPHWRLGAMEAAGGIYTSTNDLARYAAFALNAWTDGDDGGPLKKTTRKEWQTAITKRENGEPAHAVNWIVGESAALGRIVGHTGSTNDYSASLIMAPDRGFAAMVLLSSGDADDADAMAAMVLASAVTGKPVEPPASASTPPGEAHLGELKALLSQLLFEAPTKERLEAVFMPSGKPIEERVAFYQRLHDGAGACKTIDGGHAESERGMAVGVFRVGCDKGALAVKAHFANGKIDWIDVRNAPKAKTAEEVHLAEARTLVSKLLFEAPTKERFSAILASNADQMVTFFERMHAEVGACKAIDDGTPSEEDGLGIGVYRVTCEKGAVQVKAHFDKGKIDWIKLAPAGP